MFGAVAAIVVDNHYEVETEMHSCRKFSQASHHVTAVSDAEHRRPGWVSYRSSNRCRHTEPYSSEPVASD